MAGVAVLSFASPSLAVIGDGRVRSNAHGMDSQLTPLVSQSSCCTSNYIRLRGRDRAMQLSMSSVLTRTPRTSPSPRLDIVGLSERIASSQFCSCSSSSTSISSRGSRSSQMEVEGVRYFLSRGTSKVRTRRSSRVADGLKQIHFFGPPLGISWKWNTSGDLEQNVPAASRGNQPQSENLDVEGGFKFDTNSGISDGAAPAADDLELTELGTRIEVTNGSIPVASQEPPASASWRDGLSKRWIVVILCFFAFLLCNMDRVNMSIAVLPMSAEYHWSPTTVGLVQSSFFWGYLLTQVAGGIWADSIGGKQVLGFGVIWWSLATIATPIAAKIGLPALFFVRACMGVGEGVAMPAMNNLLSRWIPVEERSRALAFVYSGMYLGSVTGLACSPTLIQRFGWPSVFFSFGSVGALWFAIWQNYAYSTPADDPNISEAERKLIEKSNKPKEPITRIPWGLLLSKAPVWALIICHFCHNWGTFILLTWMPTYYNQVLGFNLMESGLFSVLPWLTMAVSANVGGWIADTLVSKGYSVTLVRKVMQSIGFLGPAFFLTQLSHITSPPMAVLCMMASQGSDAFSQAGLYSNHQDIGPRYSGILLGLSNTAGVLAGVFGTAATGYILQHGSWDDVFKVAVGLYLFGTVIWNVFATGEQLFD